MTLDTFYATTSRRTALRDWLAGELTAVPGISVFAVEPKPAAVPPFVVLDVVFTPDRLTLAGRWEVASLSIRCWSVHATRAQAEALADLVRSAMLSGAVPLAGLLDLVPDIDPRSDSPGGVPQVAEAWAATLTRT